MRLASVVKRGINTLGFEISRYNPKPKLNWQQQFFDDLLTLRGTNNDTAAFLKFCAANMEQSRAQLFQDLLVLFLLRQKRGGYFVEFGATDGIDLSNTYLLETSYECQGIVAEPARCWHRAVARNRSCSVEQRCVWSASNEMLEFNETVEAEYSTINLLSHTDFHANRRQGGKKYTVKTISLHDLLKLHNAPRQIDYLSIDTEGSELSILKSFFPTEHSIRIITVEHNHTEQRSQIHTVLTSHGYRRMFEELSKWDDWYCCLR